MDPSQYNIVFGKSIYESVIHPFFKARSRWDSNIVSIGLGEKVTNNIPTGEMAVIFGVKEKKKKSDVYTNEMLPSLLQHGYAAFSTDVQKVGPFYFPEDPRHPHKLTRPSDIPSHLFSADDATPPITRRMRPPRPGCSIGLNDTGAYITAGSFGTLVVYQGKIYVMTNWHVGCYIDGDPDVAGKRILTQPGRYDNGVTASDAFAQLAIVLERPNQGQAKTDVSLSLPLVQCDNKVLGYDWYGGPGVENAPTTELQGTGRTSGMRDTATSQMHMDVQVGLPNGASCIFHEIDSERPAPSGGDSGHARWRKSGHGFIGLCFAGDAMQGLIIPWRNIAQVYNGIQIYTGQLPDPDPPKPKILNAGVVTHQEGDPIWHPWTLNPDPDPQGVYRWRITYDVNGQVVMEAQALVYLEGESNPYFGPVRRYKVMPKETGPGWKWVPIPTMQSPTENEEIKSGIEKFFEVIVDWKKEPIPVLRKATRIIEVSHIV